MARCRASGIAVAAASGETGAAARGPRDGRPARVWSEDEHGVAVAVEAIALRDGGGVGSVNLVGRGEGHDQGQQGAFWKVEIGEECVDVVEGVWGVDENPRPGELTAACAAVDTGRE